MSTIFFEAFTSVHNGTVILISKEYAHLLCLLGRGVSLSVVTEPPSSCAVSWRAVPAFYGVLLTTSSAKDRSTGTGRRLSV